VDLKFLTNDQVVAAVIGAGLGALLMLAGAEYFQHRRDRWATRRKLLGEVMAFTFEYIALLYEAYATLRKEDTLDARLTLGARFARMNGQVCDLELRIWQVFRQRLARAAFRKLCNRLNCSRDLLFTPDGVAQEAFQVALDWIHEQRAAVGEHLCAAARVNPTDPARIVFVHFGRVTEADKRALSYEDEPPPWERTSE